jgi:hypothetical protein
MPIAATRSAGGWPVEPLLIGLDLARAEEWLPTQPEDLSPEVTAVRRCRCQVQVFERADTIEQFLRAASYFPRPITSASSMACSQTTSCFPAPRENYLNRNRHGDDHALPRLFRAVASIQQNHQ